MGQEAEAETKAPPPAGGRQGVQMAQRLTKQAGVTLPAPGSQGPSLEV